MDCSDTIEGAFESLPSDFFMDFCTKYNIGNFHKARQLFHSFLMNKCEISRDIFYHLIWRDIDTFIVNFDISIWEHSSIESDWIKNLIVTKVRNIKKEKEQIITEIRNNTASKVMIATITNINKE